MRDWRKKRMNKTIKNCCVRIPADLHRLAKLQAYKEDTTLQEWIIDLIQEKLEIDSSVVSLDNVERLSSFIRGQDSSLDGD